MLIMIEGRYGFTFTDAIGMPTNADLEQLTRIVAPGIGSVRAFYLFQINVRFEQLTRKQIALLIATKFEPGRSRGWYGTLDVVMANMIGFDGNKHTFLCDKCGGLLLGEMKREQCRCKAGGIQPSQKYITHEEAGAVPVR